MSESTKIIRDNVNAEVLTVYLKDFIADGWEEIKDDEEFKLNSLTSKDDVELMIQTIYKIDLDKRASLETMKEKAIEIIRSNKA